MELLFLWKSLNVTSRVRWGGRGRLRTGGQGRGSTLLCEDRGGGGMTECQGLVKDLIWRRNK